MKKKVMITLYGSFFKFGSRLLRSPELYGTLVKQDPDRAPSLENYAHMQIKSGGIRDQVQRPVRIHDRHDDDHDDVVVVVVNVILVSVSVAGLFP